MKLIHIYPGDTPTGLNNSEIFLLGVPNIIIMIIRYPGIDLNKLVASVHCATRLIPDATVTIKLMKS